MTELSPTLEAQVLDSAKQGAIQAYQDYRQFGRRSVESAWKCGEYLFEVRKDSERGAWMPWLEASQISKSNAYRFINLYEGYENCSQLGKFQTVDEALANLRALRAPGPTEADNVAEVTSAEVGRITFAPGEVKDANKGGVIVAAPEVKDANKGGVIVAAPEVKPALTSKWIQEPLTEEEWAEGLIRACYAADPTGALPRARKRVEDADRSLMPGDGNRR